MPSVITGANRGIGAALLSELSAHGTSVLGTARQSQPPLFRADVTDKSSLDALATHLDGQSVPLLVCNAGVLLDRNYDLATDYAPEDWAQGFAVNATGAFLAIQALLPHLQQAASETGIAKIAIVSSQMGSNTLAPGGSYIYRASKAAAVNLGRNLATDLHNLGIAVGIYHPGWVRTDMGSDAAAISPQESAAGLAKCFHALSLETTGCFETWDGRDHPL